jgi:putative ABC transport system permease protein
MIRNFLKVAWRNLVKNRTFSIINIAGLAAGLTCFILISLHIVDELSYDRYNEKADRIYRIHSDIRFGGADLKLAVASDPMGAALKKDYPQVEEYVRFYNSGSYKRVKKGSQYILERDVIHADSTLFNVFTLPAIQGDTRTALNEPNTVVISATTAKKYFETTTNAVGRVLEVDGLPYKVTAVIRDIPGASHFKADLIFSMDNVVYTWGSYINHNHQTYILLKPGTDPKGFEKKFKQYIEKYVVPQAKQFMSINSMEEFEKAGNKLEYSLMPLTDIHLQSDRLFEIGINGNIQRIYIFGTVALMVLLIACVNFMNLSTARSANRAREVGIRKVLGTDRASLIKQFLVESIVTAVFAFLIAAGAAILFLPLFNLLANKSLTPGAMFDARILPFLIILPLIVGILAGSYPALYLSAFRPIAVLKGKISGRAKKSSVRNVLVVFQFATCIFLVISTIVVYNQLRYIQSKKLGFNKEQVLVVNDVNELRSGATAFKNEILKINGVVSGTLSPYLPVSSSRNEITLSKEPVLNPQNGMTMQAWTVDVDYAKTLGLEIVQGRFFSKNFFTDSSGVVINESTAAWVDTGDVIGKKIYSFDNQDNVATALTIVGVVRNFHYESLKQNVGPLIMRLGMADAMASFKVNTSNIQQLIKEIEKKWSNMMPGRSFRYRFMDESFANMYRDEERVGQIAFTFSLLTIIISCLGLFGLATFMAEQRTREIGIRKVLGASVQRLIYLLSFDLLKPVAISFVFAAPAAWFVMNKWLQDFAYRINITWWVFVAAGLLAFVIALVTVSFQALKAARKNPIKSLRSE